MARKRKKGRKNQRRSGGRKMPIVRKGKGRRVTRGTTNKRYRKR